MKTVAILVALLATTQTPSDTDRVVAKLDEYLTAYEPKLSELIADEQMRQQIRTLMIPQTSSVSRPRGLRIIRDLASEVAFIALPNDAGWLGFRHVKSEGNKPVALADASLASTLQAPGLDAARELLNASARHNLGLPRTTNLPNLPLEFLRAHNRKRLLVRADGRDTVRGVRTLRLVFLERLTPTLITNPTTSADMPSVIRAWVEPASGRLMRAEVNTFTSFASKAFEGQIVVEFAANATLNLLVPSEMREVFAVERPGTGTSVATYTNFRRFQTSGRIVPQDRRD